MQLLNLLRLYEFTTEKRFRERAESALRAFGGQLSSSPSSLSEMLLGVDFYLDAPKEILIVTPNAVNQADRLLTELRSRFLPNRVLSVVSEGSMLGTHEKLIPILELKVARDAQATAYVCEQGVCELPTTMPRVFGQQLGKVNRLPD